MASDVQLDRAVLPEIRVGPATIGVDDERFGPARDLDHADALRSGSVEAERLDLLGTRFRHPDFSAHEPDVVGTGGERRRPDDGALGRVEDVHGSRRAVGGEEHSAAFVD